MNNFLFKSVGIFLVIGMVILGAAITKNYIIDPSSSLAAVPVGGGGGYLKGCMNERACNYDEKAKTAGDCIYSIYINNATSKPEIIPLNQNTADISLVSGSVADLDLAPVPTTPKPKVNCQGLDCEIQIAIRTTTISPAGKKLKETIKPIGAVSKQVSSLYIGKNACADPKK